MGTDQSCQKKVKGDGKMNYNKNISWGKMIEETPISLLHKVVSDLKNADDIKGAAIIYKNNHFLAHEMSDNMDLVPKIPYLLKNVDEGSSNMTLYGHTIKKYDGLKIILKELENDLTLLVILQRDGYISLAMIDIENSIRCIEEILKKSPSISSYEFEKEIETTAS
jgi:predicted regulator of Ras-like GTPase activity (Roadblock/LC7/MglB family)